MSVLGGMVKRARENLPGKISIRKFAELVGVTQSYMSKVERGKETPGAETILRIAELAGVSPDEMLQAAGHMDPGLYRILVSRYAELADLLKLIGELSSSSAQELTILAANMART